MVRLLLVSRFMTSTCKKLYDDYPGGCRERRKSVDPLSFSIEAHQKSENPALQAGESWRFIDLSASARDDGRLAGVVAVHLSWP